GCGWAVRWAARVAIGLTNPVPDRLGGRFELARQLLRCSPRSDQINHLSPELRRVGSMTLRHRWHLLLKWKGVHQTGSTPKRHWDGILRWFDSKIANGLIEGINSLIQAAKAKARGYRSTRNLKAIIYLLAGKLDMRLPA